MSQCVWRLAFKNFHKRQKTLNRHRTRRSVQRHFIEKLGHIEDIFKKLRFHISNRPSWGLWDLSFLALTTAAMKATWYPSRETCQIHSKKNKTTKERGQKWSTFSFLAFFFFFFTSALVVFYHKRHRKPQKITFKKRQRKLWKPDFIESPDDVNANLKLEKQT